MVDVLRRRTRVGDFEIVRLLGTGSMGHVYLASQSMLGRQVALKVLRRSLTVDEESVARFFSEMRTLAKIDHPSVVSVFSAGEDSGNYYMAMSYVDGMTLEDELERGGPIAEGRALGLAEQVAEALGHIWDRHRILHRDIKPGNLMVDRQGQVRVLDLGIAKDMLTAAVTMRGFTLGTPRYMSPEQARGDDLDCRADIYSLGSTLYELLTGEPLFPGRPEEVLTLLMVASVDEGPLQAVGVSEAARSLLCRMLATDREDRPSTWEEVLEALRAVRSGEASPASVALPASVLAEPGSGAVAAVDAGGGDAPSSARRRDPVLAVLAVLAVLVGVVLGVALFGMPERQSAAAKPVDGMAAGGTSGAVDAGGAGPGETVPAVAPSPAVDQMARVRRLHRQLRAGFSEERCGELLALVAGLPAATRESCAGLVSDARQMRTVHRLRVRFAALEADYERLSAEPDPKGVRVLAQLYDAFRAEAAGVAGGDDWVLAVGTLRRLAGVREEITALAAELEAVCAGMRDRRHEARIAAIREKLERLMPQWRGSGLARIEAVLSGAQLAGLPELVLDFEDAEDLALLRARFPGVRGRVAEGVFQGRLRLLPVCSFGFVGEVDGEPVRGHGVYDGVLVIGGRTVAGVTLEGVFDHLVFCE